MAIESYGKLPTTGRSPYLERKLGDSDVSGTRFRGTVAEYAFVDPLTQQIVGLQRIMPNGKKMTVEGSTLIGAGVFLNGLPPKNYEGKIRIGESVTTTETVRRAQNDNARLKTSCRTGNSKPISGYIDSASLNYIALFWSLLTQNPSQNPGDRKRSGKAEV